MSNENRQYNISETLKHDLKRLYKAPEKVPPAMDKAILDMARSQLRPKPLLLFRILSAAAAVLILSIGLLTVRSLFKSDHSIMSALTSGPLRAEDLDCNDSVNILDALYLARKLPVPAKSNPDWDFNGDGSINQKDIDHIAYLAVHLKTQEVL